MRCYSNRPRNEKLYLLGLQYEHTLTYQDNHTHLHHNGIHSSIKVTCTPNHQANGLDVLLASRNMQQRIKLSLTCIKFVMKHGTKVFHYRPVPKQGRLSKHVWLVNISIFFKLSKKE